jgi:hypothetical protein
MGLNIRVVPNNFKTNKAAYRQPGGGAGSLTLLSLLAILAPWNPEASLNILTDSESYVRLSWRSKISDCGC